MRICSFLPSATEIIYALNADKQLVGVTHECDYPLDAKNKPVVVKGAVNTKDMDSKSIDEIIVKMVREQKDIYIIDDNKLRDADPDIIIAQGLCSVCSPYFKEIDRAKVILNNKPKIVMLDPHNLEEIFDSIIQVGKAIDKEDKAIELVDKLRVRIDYIKQFELEKPNVLALEWLDPLYTAGHWVPDMINIVGNNLISEGSKPSRRLEWDEAFNAEPDIIILMACGFNTDRIVREFSKVRDENWNRLINNKKVYAVDASAYFNRPGPRVVTGIEILAKIIHSDLFADLKVPNNSFKRII
ncbi:MAG: cobalamin-binding protein [Candidatus Nitrosothermus koennekii]|nr:MAG: cobalamin-binding protein [Candidatus Nitrosothermus koennekii]